MGKGTGLGLAVVYGLVVEMGGRIEVDNQDGAVFTIFFPADHAPHP
jgi:signal transduction histidine kinase